MKTERLVVPLQYASVILGGAVFSLVIWMVLRLETRYAIAALLGITLASATLVLFKRLQDLLFYLVLFNVPFVGFEKSLFTQSDAIVSTPGIGVGLAELLLIAVYAHWFLRVCVTREESAPRLNRTDLWALGYVGAHVLSWIGSASQVYSTFEIVRVSKYALVYFYVSRHMKRSHWKGIIVLLLVTVLSQSLLGIYQAATGNLIGFGAAKGADADAIYDFKSLVPGFQRPQAAGTLLTPHCLGVYLTMLLTILLALMMEPSVKVSGKWFIAGVAALGIGCVAATFARGAWLALAIVFVLAIIVYIPRSRQAIVVASVMVVCAIPLLLVFREGIRSRLFDSPPEIMEVRRDLNRLAWDLFTRNPVLGVGANAFYQAHDEYDPSNLMNPYKKPAVHNLVLFIASQTGIIGIMTFFGMLISAARRAVKVAARAPGIPRALATGLLLGLLAEQIEGITNFAFYTNVLYYWLWFSVGMTVALDESTRTEPADKGLRRGLIPIRG